MKLPDQSQPEPAPQPKKQLPIGEGAQGKVKRPVTRRLRDYVFASSPKDVARKIGGDILAPRLKAAVEEALGAGIHGLLWPGGQQPLPPNVVQGTVLRPGGGTNYHMVGQPNMAHAVQVPNKSSGNYTDLVFGSQQAAEQALANAYSVFNQYRMLAVADLYEMNKISPAPSDGAFGWMSLDGSRITKSRDGYVLELPRPSLL